MAKKKKAEEKVDTVSLTDAIREDFAKQGLHLIRGEDLRTNQELRRPYGIPSLDIEAGGGAGAGSVTILYGPEGAGKTWLSIKNLAETQKRYQGRFKGLFMSLGLPIDKPFSRIHGLRIPFGASEREAFIAKFRSHHGLDPTPAEVKEAGRRVGDIDFLFADYSSPKALERVLEGFTRLIETREYQIAIIDDMGAVAPSETSDTPLDTEDQRAPFARLMTRFTGKLQKFLNYHKGEFNPTSIITTVQVRANQAGKGFSLPFGRALRHNTSTIIRISKDTDEGKNDMVWRITRGKYGHGEGATGVIPFNAYSGIDVDGDLVRTAVRNGVVKQAGAYFRYGDMEKNVLGYDAIISYIVQNSLQAEIWQQLLYKKGLEIRYE